MRSLPWGATREEYKLSRIFATGLPIAAMSSGRTVCRETCDCDKMPQKHDSFTFPAQKPQDSRCRMGDLRRIIYAYEIDSTSEDLAVVSR
jgi:hypothetical protein